MNDFYRETNRTNTRSVKWDLRETYFKEKDIIPMWVADMDFQTPVEVKNALTDRVNHGVFGYTITDANIHTSIQSWLSKRYGWEIEHDWLLYSPGVVPTLHTIIQSCTEPGDDVLIQTPVYFPFYDVIKDHGRNIVKNSLSLQNGRYEIDFEDFEKKIKHVSAFILCNPHNPVGRVWSKEELTKMGELCMRHDVLLISDEIHSDLIYPGHTHIPVASLSEDIAKKSVTLMSPTKTFNLAGLQVSYAVTPNKEIKKKIKHQFHLQGQHLLNTMGITALEAAYNHGEYWVDELVEVLNENKKHLLSRIHASTDKIKVIDAEGTYLIWLDCRNLNMKQPELKQFMRSKAKVALNDGMSFGEEGEGFMRINIACPPSILEQGISRILSAVTSL